MDKATVRRWEFCHNADATDLDHTAAYEFLEDYSRFAPLPSGLPADLIPWVRWHLAYEIGRAQREHRRGIPIDADYLDAECQAFASARCTEDEAAPHPGSTTRRATYSPDRRHPGYT